MVLTNALFFFYVDVTVKDMIQEAFYETQTKHFLSFLIISPLRPLVLVDQDQLYQDNGLKIGEVILEFYVIFKTACEQFEVKYNQINNLWKYMNNVK